MTDLKGIEAFDEVKRLIVIAAHADDLETMCGGTIAKLARRGMTIFSVNCTLGDIGAQSKEMLRWTLAALALWLVGWTGWWQWRIRRDRATLPFARAWAAMRRIADGDAAGWHALHRAFDASAGGVVDRSSTERLFARRPEFRPLAGDIERFYRLSAARFFADRQAADEFSPRRLCRALMRIERRHSR